MAKQTPFTSQEERLERLIRNARAEVVALKGMIDTARSVVAAQYVKLDDPSSPQVLRVSEDGGLDLGNEKLWEVIGVITEEASHTGDTNPAIVGTITVPANSMGEHGILRIHADWRAEGAGTHYFYMQFAGHNIRWYWSTGTNLIVDFPDTFVWNKGDAGEQGMGVTWVAYARTAESVGSMSVDTAADVDVTFVVENSDASAEGFLRFALVEAYHSG